ncbi:MAG: type II toxin-antitoxin system RelE/ParE family toxin [Bacteroidales bacterium]|nr:type II toxin-antitoxin system RelE/ParE family toxin [Bacteroidales bacterium]
MKSASYRISEKAIEDIETIWVFTLQKWSIEQADRYYNLIIDEIEFISKNFMTGKSMEHIKKGYRSSVVKSHLIFYRKSENNQIEIIRILHQSMDIENIINK